MTGDAEATVQDRRQPIDGTDAEDAAAASSARRRSDDWLRVIRKWCRERARRKSEIAKMMAPLRSRQMPHDEIRVRLGLTVEDYRRARRWYDDAMRESEASVGPVTFEKSRDGGVSFEEALLLHEDREVELVSRFALLKRRGATRDQIRARLKLTHDGYDDTSEWYRDAIAATTREG